MSTTTAKPLKMSDTALKFGPEWLRALSHGDTAVSPPPSPSLGAPRYKLAEHRYGREEMLALFDKMMKAPDDLVIAPPLYVEKTQLPLALVQMTDEEMRMWQRGVNSDVVLKLMGRSTGGGPSVGSGGPPGPVASRGRGGSMDRGRGRGRGLGSAVGAYNRGTSYEDDAGEHGRREGPPTGYGRGSRPFERPQTSTERAWVERSDRNGGSEEWNGGSTSPRKDFGRPFADNNWRSRDAKERERGESKEEEDGWRTAGRGERWGRSGWRSDRERESEREGGNEKGDRFFGKGERDGWDGQGSGQGQTPAGSERERHRGWDSESRPAAGGSNYYANKRPIHRRGWDDHDTLPEWAAEDMQGGGTFDASGAFRDERWSDEDDVGDERKRSGGSDGGEDPGQQKRMLPDEDAEPSGTVDDETNTHQVESVEVKDGNQTVSKEASVESQLSEGGSSMTGEPVVASPSQSASDQLEDVRTAMESGLSMPTVDPVDHHDHRVCEEDGLEHAQAVASTLVAQLVEDEDHPKEVPIPNHHAADVDHWFYRDPQGEVQGPFTSAEMAEWFNSGYFTMALSVRRACDERFVQLGELTKMWGVRLPFLAGHTMPPLKPADVNPIVAEQEKIHMIQQQLIQQQLFQQQMMQQQQLLMRQQSLVSKLSQMDGWNTLSPVQQQQIVNQHMLNMPPHVTGIVGSDPLLQQLRIQMEAQAKLQAELLHRKDSVQSMVNLQQPQQQPPQPQQHPKAPESVLEPSAQMKQDPIQAFVQQLLGQPKGPTLSKSPQLPSKPVEMDPIQSLLQQAQWNAAQPGGPNVGNNVEPHAAHIAPGFHGMPPGPGLVPWPPHTLSIGMGGMPMTPAMYSHAPTEPPTSVWDLENATSVEENKQRMMEQQQLAEIRRREDEEKRMMEEEERKRREREVQEREEERKRMEQMRREAEARQQAEEMRRRNELERQQMEEKRRREEEKRRKEEELRQQQAEEERMRREEERIRKEEERAAEQQRRQQEALQRLQEQQAAAQAQARAQAQAQQAAVVAAAQQSQSKNQTSTVAPWAHQQQQQQQQQQQPQNSESLSLAEIQKLQEEKELKEKAAAQVQKMEQAARIALQQQQQQAATKLRWGKQNVSTTAKSLAEIQAEEAAQLARQKEKERVEKASQQVNLNLAAAGAWGSSHSSSAWSSGRTAAAVVSQNLPPANHVNSNWKTGSVGFWEDPAPPKPQAPSQPQQSPAPANKPVAAASSAGSSSKAAKQQQQQSKGTTATSVNKKNRNNKEEETVRKLFGQSTDKKDSFSQWCFEYLKKVQAPIDVPTFVCFLKDVESPFEVQDYVRSYLGEGKEAKEFAKQFLEQRSKLRQLQRSVQQYEEDNMCIPAKAVNPGQASDFHEVKSKSKKSKKKMQKVDASLLGFSVSASTDRINVGERDFVEGM